MEMLKRANARLAGARLYLLAVIFALPDASSALVDFDWTRCCRPGTRGSASPSAPPPRSRASC